MIAFAEGDRQAFRIAVSVAGRAAKLGPIFSSEERGGNESEGERENAGEHARKPIRIAGPLASRKNKRGAFAAPALTHGVIRAGAPGSAHVGFATVNGQDFASYHPAPLVNAVVPVTSAVVTGALANPAILSTANVNLVSSGSIAAATIVSVNTLKLNGDNLGQALTLGIGATTRAACKSRGPSPAQLNSIYFYDDAGVFLGTAHYLPSGEIVPVPEPVSTLFGLLPLLGLGFHLRRSPRAES